MADRRQVDSSGIHHPSRSRSAGACTSSSMTAHRSGGATSSSGPRADPAGGSIERAVPRRDFERDTAVPPLVLAWRSGRATASRPSAEAGVVGQVQRHVRHPTLDATLTCVSASQRTCSPNGIRTRVATIRRAWCPPAPPGDGSGPDATKTLPKQGLRSCSPNGIRTRVATIRRAWCPPAKPLLRRDAERTRTEAQVRSCCSPNGIRTRVATLRGWCPRPLDDGARSVVKLGGEDSNPQ